MWYRSAGVAGAHGPPRSRDRECSSHGRLVPRPRARLHVTRVHSRWDERTGRPPSVLDGSSARPPRPRGGEVTTTKRAKKAKTREKVIIPTPEEWAEEQLKNAPPRSEEWARKVALIYCLDIEDDNNEEKPA